MEDLQKKELEEQLEAEQYFSTLYKTQVITMNYSNGPPCTHVDQRQAFVDYDFVAPLCLGGLKIR